MVQEVSWALVAAALLDSARTKESLWQRILVGLRMWRFSACAKFIDAVREQIDHGTGYALAWDHFFCVLLWPLSIVSFLVVCFSIHPSFNGVLNADFDWNLWASESDPVESNSSAVFSNSSIPTMPPSTHPTYKRYLWEVYKGYACMHACMYPCTHTCT